MNRIHYSTDDVRIMQNNAQILQVLTSKYRCDTLKLIIGRRWRRSWINMNIIQE